MSLADANKDGAVTRAEFDAAMAARMQEKQTKMQERSAEMFTRLDANKDGRVTRDELDAMPPIGAYDANKDGQLDTAEAQKLWNDVVSYDYSGEIVAQVTQAQNWFGQFDTNRDGKLSFGELAKALNTEIGATSFASVKKVDPVEQKLQELADWIMTNYDVNKDQALSESEAQKLWRDI
jgi:Ca2+-binding EF-hand superfamily protein